MQCTLRLVYNKSHMVHARCHGRCDAFGYHIPYLLGGVSKINDIFPDIPWMIRVLRDFKAAFSQSNNGNNGASNPMTNR